MRTIFLTITLSILVFTAMSQNTDKKQNKVLIQQLDSILNDDQTYRIMSDTLEQKYGYKSKIVQDLWQKIHDKDSINLIKVSAIIDKYGWLGADMIGKKGSLTLFLVIQHSDLKTQEKYLPIMKEAVKRGNASGSDLALLVDRIEMFNGRPQIYGSQIQMKDEKFVIYPILDEVNVNKRRAEVGLEPLEEYAKNWKIEYKLPAK